MANLASVSPLVVVGAGGVTRGGHGGVGQDVDEVLIHHVVVEKLEDFHSIRSVCGETNTEVKLGLSTDSEAEWAWPLCRDIPGFMGLKLMSMGSAVLVLTCTMAEVGNTRMCVQDVS